MAQTTRVSLFLGVCCAMAAYGIAIVRQNYLRRREAPHVLSWLPVHVPWFRLDETLSPSCKSNGPRTAMSSQP